MTGKQYAELLEYIQKNNSWEHMYELIHERNRNVYKYVSANYDTRDGTIYCVTLKRGGEETGRQFKTESDVDIKRLYEHLDRQKEPEVKAASMTNGNRNKYV